MDWKKTELVVAANKTRVIVTIAPNEVFEEVDWAGKSIEEKAKMIANTIEKLKQKFTDQFLALAEPYIDWPKKPKALEEPKEETPAPPAPPIEEPKEEPAPPKPIGPTVPKVEETKPEGGEA